MDPKLQVIYDSLHDIGADMKKALEDGNIELVRYQLYRGYRLKYKVNQSIEEAVANKKSMDILSYYECQKAINEIIGSWYSKMGSFFNEQNDEEFAEREWFQSILEGTKDPKRYIQYAHQALELRNLSVKREIKDVINNINPTNVKEINICIHRLKMMLNIAMKELGHNQEIAYILSWLEQLEKEIKKNEELVHSLNKKDENIPLDKVMGELEELIGLKEVKQKIKEIAYFVSFNQLRKTQGFKTDEIGLHMVFSGNPGTGKTTVARLVAKILKAIGYLKKGHLVEVGRSDLVGEYIGHTAVKTMSKIKEAREGILFIDEAYSLVRGSENDFGIEAIDTLVKAMEDERKNLVVILAGYPKEMQTFIEANPGLQSRFKNHINFPDYTIDELMKITDLLLKKQDFRMTNGAKEIFRKVISKNVFKHPETHGNGRLVRNLIEDAIMKKATITMEKKTAGLPYGDLDLIDEFVLNQLKEPVAHSNNGF